MAQVISMKDYETKIKPILDQINYQTRIYSYTKDEANELKQIKHLIHSCKPIISNKYKILYASSEGHYGTYPHTDYHFNIIDMTSVVKETQHQLRLTKGYIPKGSVLALIKDR